LRGALQTLIRALDRRELSLCLSSLQRDRLDLRFGLRNLGLHFGGFQGNDRFTLFYKAASIDIDLLDETNHLRLNWHIEVRKDLTGQSYFGVNCLRLNGHHVNRRLRASACDNKEKS